VSEALALVIRLAKIWDGCTSVTIETWAKDGYAEALRKVVAVAEAAVRQDTARRESGDAFRANRAAIKAKQPYAVYGPLWSEHIEASRRAAAASEELTAAVAALRGAS
jgi:hypothetical protein